MVECVLCVCEVQVSWVDGVLFKRSCYWWRCFSGIALGVEVRCHDWKKWIWHENGGLKDEDNWLYGGIDYASRIINYPHFFFIVCSFVSLCLYIFELVEGWFVLLLFCMCLSEVTCLVWCYMWFKHSMISALYRSSTNKS